MTYGLALSRASRYRVFAYIFRIVALNIAPNGGGGK